MKDMPAPHFSSGWYGKVPDKICRACYGKVNQRAGAGSSGAQRAGACRSERIPSEEEDDDMKLKSLQRVIGSR